MEIVKIFIVGLVSLVLVGCPDQEDPIDSRLIIRNLSPDAIVYSVEINMPADTTLIHISYPLSPQNIDPITIFSLESDTLSESFIKILSEDFPDYIMMIYLFSKDTIDQVPWSRIRDEYLVLQRYDLTLDDLEAMNWTVEYP